MQWRGVQLEEGRSGGIFVGGSSAKRAPGPWLLADVACLGLGGCSCLVSEFPREEETLLTLLSVWPVRRRFLAFWLSPHFSTICSGV